MGWSLRAWLTYPHVGMRFLGALVLTLAALIASWAVSYLLLPEHLLQFRYIRTAVATAGLWRTWGKILAINLGMGVGGLVLLNQWQDRWGVACGYYLLVWRSGIFVGVLVGTNSFAFPAPDRLSALIRFFGLGFWESLAMVMACAATAPMARYPIHSGAGLTAFLDFLREPVAHLSAEEIWTLVAACALTIAMAGLEANRIATSSPI